MQSCRAKTTTTTTTTTTGSSPEHTSSAAEINHRSLQRQWDQSVRSSAFISPLGCRIVGNTRRRRSRHVGRSRKLSKDEILHRRIVICSELTMSSTFFHKLRPWVTVPSLHSEHQQLDLMDSNVWFTTKQDPISLSYWALHSEHDVIQVFSGRKQNI